MSAMGEERRERRRVGALLGAYYRIEENAGQSSTVSAASAAGELDAQGFNAQQYFDSTVASGKMPELVRRSRDLDAQIKQLDGEMQLLVYENYTKFTRAVDVIKQMKFCLEGLEPDIQQLEGSIGRVAECERLAEDGVSARSSQLEVLLKRQRLCKKLQVLFALPTTLSRCLNRCEYGKAVEAYCCCSDFLRQYKHMPSFKKVLEDVEHQMNQIGSALEFRLRAPYLSVDEAVNSSLTLLDMGKDHTKVVREYLAGRTAVLRQSLNHCFCGEPITTPGLGRHDVASNGAEPSRDEQELQLPESQSLHSACWRATDSYVPQLCDAVEGCQRLQAAATGEGAVTESLLQAFVSERVEELCRRISELLQDRRPPTRVLVACVHSVRDALRRVHTATPQLVSKVFMAFLSRTASEAMRGIFSDTAAFLVQTSKALHSDCKRLQESANPGIDDVLEQIAKTEQALLKNCFGALLDCQPLLNLLGPDRVACQPFLRDMQAQLMAVFWAFAEVCFRYIGQDPLEMRMMEAAMDSVPRTALAELDSVDSLDWSGVFALALVRIGRHFEMKVIAKVWSVARDIVSEHLGAPLDPAEHGAGSPAAMRSTRAAAQSVISHYAIVSGQRLASFFRNSIQNKNWMTVREPRSPSVLVETVILKEVLAFDAQLARILGDPRKARASDRRPLSRFKDSMELEIERLVAKKLRVFAPIPFNRNGAIVGILRIAFKALFEYMREETFAKFGVQQIQVDCAFLADMVRDFAEAEDASALDSLLDEAVTSAAQRCEGAVLMDRNIVAQLIAERKEKLTEQT